MKIKPFKLERYFAKYEFKTPYTLCSSDCESASIGELLQMEKGASDSLNNVWLGYTESQGDPELRELIAELYTDQTAKDIIIFTGAEEAIYIFMNILLNKGDNIIVQTPCYQSLFEVAASIGSNVTRWEMCADNNWFLDIEKLEDQIKPTTKVLVINSPHNPTGYCIPHDDYKKIISIAEKFGIMVFSDEVYKFSEYDKKDSLPAMCDLYDSGISLGVMSKSFGLAGLRIGWIASKNERIKKDIMSYKDYTTICNSAPSEFLAKIALRNQESLLSRNLNLLNTNLKLLENFFSNNSSLFSYCKPKAGSIMFPEIKADITAEDFCAGLIEKKGVLLLPGNLYENYPKHFRLGFGRKNMPAALNKLQEYITENFRH